jgi:hypothetical protein
MLMLVIPAAVSSYQARYVVPTVPVFCVAAALAIREIGNRNQEAVPQYTRMEPAQETLPVAADFGCVPIAGLGGRLVGATEYLAELSEPGRRKSLNSEMLRFEASDAAWPAQTPGAFANDPS